MRAEQVLDLQADFLARSEDQEFNRIMKLALSSGDFSQGQRSSEAVWFAAKNHMKASYAYYVTSDMSTLVQHAADGLDETDRIDLSLAPTGCGFVYFERPLPVNDIRGRVMLLHMLSWGPVMIETTTSFGTVRHSGCGLLAYNDMDKPDEVSVQMFQENGKNLVQRLVGRWGFVGTSMMKNGADLGPSEDQLDEKTKARILEFESSSPYVRPFGDLESQVSYSYTNIDRYVHALWLLLNQTITQTTEEHVSKTTLKRAKHYGLPGRVTVVHLRRLEGSEQKDGETHVEWMRRWIVRGHWRWQPCGPGRKERVRIWINSYIGNARRTDLPLVVPDKVYSLSR